MREFVRDSAGNREERPSHVDGAGFWPDSPIHCLAGYWFLPNKPASTFESWRVLGSQNSDGRTSLAVLHGRKREKQHDLHVLRDRREQTGSPKWSFGPDCGHRPLLRQACTGGGQFAIGLLRLLPGTWDQQATMPERHIVSFLADLVAETAVDVRHKGILGALTTDTQIP